MFGFLFLNFGHLRGVDEIEIRETMLHAIESRWNRADQDVFIACVILNPFHKTEPLTTHPSLTNAGVYALLVRLWKRFYKATPPYELHTNLCDYFAETGPYVGMTETLNAIRLDCTEHVSNLLTFDLIVSIVY